MNSYLPAWASSPNFQDSVILSAMWEGRERIFEVTFSYDRVYFRVQDEPKRVFAALETCSPEELESSFKSAISSGDFGFYFVASNDRTGWANGLFLRLRAICHPTGVGWIREWSSPNWLWFNPNATRGLAFVPEYLFPHSGRKIPEWFFPVSQQKREELLFRDVSNAEFNGILSRWMRGSDEEFNRISSLLWKAGLIRERENKLSQWQIRGISLAHYNAENESSQLWFDYANYVGHPKLLDFLNHRLDLRGYDWDANRDWEEKYKNLFLKFPRIRARFQQQRAKRFYSLNDWERSTSHEQLEASLELRAYLEEIAEEENLSEQDLDSWCVLVQNP